MKDKKLIQFMATRKIPKKVEINFKTREGEKVSFKATRLKSKRERVAFYANKK